MDLARADALAARSRLASQWIAARSESFRHLTPPPAAAWIGEEGLTPFDEAAASTDGWTVMVLPSAAPAEVDVCWLDARDSGQRAELMADLPAAGDDEAAPFAWAHRALMRCGLRLRIAPAPKNAITWLHVDRRGCAAVEAPLLRLELLPGARCVLLETHAGTGSHRVAQNMQVDLRLDEGASLQHLRHVAPAAGDRVAHHLHARLAADASYAQALLATGADYHLQRNVFDLQGAHAKAVAAGVLLADGATLEQQLLARHAARQTVSSGHVLALASGAARVVANAHTRIAPGCDEASTQQRLSGIPTSGRPRIVLRPHLEIHHDQVQAAHGATWGALPEEALFHARQRGLDERAAKALILQGLARAALARAVDDEDFPEAMRLDGALALDVARHLGFTENGHG